MVDIGGESVEKLALLLDMSTLVAAERRNGEAERRHLPPGAM
jgi:hypothetical protein